MQQPTILNVHMYSNTCTYVYIYMYIMRKCCDCSHTSIVLFYNLSFFELSCVRLQLCHHTNKLSKNRKKVEFYLILPIIGIKKQCMWINSTNTGLCDVALWHTATPPQHCGAAVHSPHWDHLGATVFLSPSKQRRVKTKHHFSLSKTWKIKPFLCDPTAEHFHLCCCVFKRLCFTTRQSKTLLKIFVCVLFFAAHQRRVANGQVSVR